MKKLSKTPLFAAADIFIIALVLALAAVPFFISVKGAGAPLSASVKINGRYAGSYPLDNAGEFKLVGENGIEMTLVVDGDGVFVKDSSCRDKICERTGKITREGQSVICMPGRISIALEGETGGADAVVG